MKQNYLDSTHTHSTKITESSYAYLNAIAAAAMVNETVNVSASTSSSNSLSSSDRLVADKTREMVLESSAKEELEAITNKPGRLVENHHTYCEGLRPVLQRLQKSLPKCTIVPGIITQTDQARREHLEVEVKAGNDDHTFKLIARNGQTVQKLKISFPSKQTMFTIDYLTECINSALSPHSDQNDSSSDQLDSLINYAGYNRQLHDERSNRWKKTNEEMHRKTLESQRTAKREKEEKKQARILATKGVDSEVIPAMAKRDLDILSGENRTKNSMKK